MTIGGVPDIFIELDSDRDFADLDELPQRPSRFGKRWRPWAAAGLVVALLSTLGGGGPRPGNGVRVVAELATHPAVRMVQVDGRLILLEPNLLRAFDLADGRQVWQLRIGIREGYHHYVDGYLIVNGYPDWNDPNGSSESLALDPATGAVRWRLPGSVEVFEELLISYEASPLPQRPTAATVIYNRAAERIWSLPQDEWISAINGRRSLISSVNPETGELVERQLRTGAVANRYTFPELRGVQGMHYNKKNVAYFYFDDGRMMSFDGTTIQKVSDELGFNDLEPVDCGQVMCHYGRQTPGYYLTDKATGRKVYENSDWEFLAMVGQSIAGLRYGDEDGPMKLVSVFDPSTGKVTEPEGWSLLGAGFSYPPTQPTGGRTYAWSYRKQLDYFGLLEDGTVRLIGVLPHTGELRTCVVHGPYLACATGAELVRIWQLT